MVKVSLAVTDVLKEEFQAAHVNMKSDVDYLIVWEDLLYV